MNENEFSTCVHGFRHHGNHGDHDGGDDVEDGEDHVDLDRPLPLRVLVSEDRDAEDTEADGEPGRKAHKVHESVNVGRAEVAEGEEGREEDSGGWGHLLGLDHGEHLRHLTLEAPGVKEASRGEENAIDAAKTGHRHEDRDTDGEGAVEDLGEGRCDRF